MSKHIIFIHHLNNYTGSPNVLGMVIRGLIAKGYSAELITNRDRGFLSDISGLKYHYTCYRWCGNGIATLGLLLAAELEMFMRCLLGKRDCIYYINTVVPFGAILGCWLTRKKFVIHVHENMMQKKALYAVLRRVYGWCNKRSIFVSDYLVNQAYKCRNHIVIPNALTNVFRNTAENFIGDGGMSDGNMILMVSSYRIFKGIYEFAELARRLPEYQFVMVLATDNDGIRKYMDECGEISNMNVYPRQENLHPFYQKAKVLLQLSHPNEWVETFGLTILEAMAYGIPAIVPDVGGPAELITDGINGFTLNPMDMDLLTEKTQLLMENDSIYQQMRTAALDKVKKYSEDKFIESICNYIK